MAFALIFLGFHVTFLAMHWVGLMGQRRRISTYLPEDGWTVINLISSVGGFVMAFGLTLVLIEILLNLAVRHRARRNPWGSGTLEWAIPRPSAAYNFASLPRVNSREPLWDKPALPAQLARGDGYLGDAATGQRESLMVDIATGEPEQLVIYPANTRLPILLAAVTGVFFVSLLIKVYVITPFAIAIAAVAALGWRWVWQLGSRQDLGEQPIGHGALVPTIAEVSRPPGWWGSVFLLVANATLFGSLLFGYAFLWTIAPGWPPPAFMEPSLPTMLAAASGAVLAAGGTAMAVRNNQNGSNPFTALLAALAGALGLVVAFAAMLWSAPSAAGHAYNSTIVVLGSYGLFHAVVTSLMVLFLLARQRAGYMSQRRRGEVSIVMVWSIYLFVVTGLIMLAVYLPGLIG